jgi:hypothetical protein
VQLDLKSFLYPRLPLRIYPVLQAIEFQLYDFPQRSLVLTYHHSHLTMATTLSFQPTNFQLQSPLFGVLPGEIRNEIFAYALMQYEDDAASYPEDSYWYRPGFSGPRKANSALLQTCKAVYAEGQKVFLRELEWAFWFGTCICRNDNPTP